MSTSDVAGQAINYMWHGDTVFMRCIDWSVHRLLPPIVAYVSRGWEWPNAQAQRRSTGMVPRFTERDKHETSADFRHVQKRPLQRLVRPQADDVEEGTRREVLLPEPRAARHQHPQAHHSPG